MSILQAILDKRWKRYLADPCEWKWNENYIVELNVSRDASIARAQRKNLRSVVEHNLQCEKPKSVSIVCGKIKDKM